MKKAVIVPSAGESVTEGDLSNWVKKSGEFVQAGEIIAEVETDKATLEINAPTSGVLTTKVKQGDKVKIGSTIAEIDEEGKATGTVSAPKVVATELKKEVSTVESKGTGKKVDVVVPSAGESVTEGDLVRWVKKDGQSVQAGETIAEVETDKATLEVNSPTSGKLVTKAKEGDKVKIGSVIAVVEEGASGSSASASPTPTTTSNSSSAGKMSFSISGSGTQEKSSSYATGHPSPSAGRIMREEGISSSDIEATGKGGRITKNDVMGVEVKGHKISGVSNVMRPSSSNEDSDDEMASYRSKLSPMRKALMSHLYKESERRLPATIYNEINMHQLMVAHEQYGEEFHFEENVELSYVGFFLRAISLGLERFPSLNCVLEGDEIIFNESPDISLSFNSESNSTVMAVLREVDIKGFSELEQEVLDMEEKAFNGELTMEETTGGTFSMISMGERGSMLSAPTLYGGQSATLALHTIEDRAIVSEGEVKVAPMMYVSLTYNRLTVEDADAVDFLIYVKSLIENPIKMIIFD